MGEHANKGWFKTLAWMITAIVSCLSLLLIGSTLRDIFF
jgi:Mn2+/Fe2+ NRAMP family transporter